MDFTSKLKTYLIYIFIIFFCGMDDRNLEQSKKANKRTFTQHLISK